MSPTPKTEHDEDDLTPVERPRRSSSALTLFGNIDAWLSRGQDRYIVWTSGLTFRVVNESVGEVIVRVQPDEDVSTAIWKRGVLILIGRE